jgi:hypothetical protein
LVQLQIPQKRGKTAPVTGRSALESRQPFR